jgi:phospholipid/cholesterol/gamma-HCH transport system substrate-binding protein
MPDRHKNDLNIEIIVGLFMFLILLALGVFTIVLSRQNFWQEKYPVHVLFKDVGGLREGDNVFLRGTQVGTVKSTFLRDHHVEVVAVLDIPIELHQGYKVEVVASSMLGGKIMKIHEGKRSTPRIDPSEKLFGAVPVDILDELSGAVKQLRTFSDQLADGEGTLGRLLQDDSLYENINAGAASFKTVGEKLENGEGTLGKLLSEEDVYNELSAIMHDLREVAGRANWWMTTSSMSKPARFSKK